MKIAGRRFAGVFVVAGAMALGLCSASYAKVTLRDARGVIPVGTSLIGNSSDFLVASRRPDDLVCASNELLLTVTSNSRSATEATGLDVAVGCGLSGPEPLRFLGAGMILEALGAWRLIFKPSEVTVEPANSAMTTVAWKAWYDEVPVGWSGEVPGCTASTSTLKLKTKAGKAGSASPVVLFAHDVSLRDYPNSEANYELCPSPAYAIGMWEVSDANGTVYAES